MLFRALEVQGRVIEALFMREIKSRFGEKRLGFLWVFLEPAMHIMVFVIIWRVLGRLGPHGINPILFLLTGVVPYLLFTNTVVKVMKSIALNRSLLVFPQIVALDFVLARMLMEFMTYIVVFVGFLIGLRFAGLEYEIKDWLGVMVDFLLILFLAAGLGLMFSPFTSMFGKVVEQGVRISMRFLYISSGVFYSIDRFPVEYRPYIVWNPLLHLIHLTRADFFPQMSDNVQYGNIKYVLALTILFWFFGITLFKKLFRFILEE